MRMMRGRETPIIVVVVHYPAIALLTSRVRFCVSAAYGGCEHDLESVQ
jgi:serine palmitoyltransferase